ncbi:hypothetical protein A6U97_27815 [Agrobacterium tumefaciens]|nr:hypothetical protein A6U97_27815 [Agrobacterium tumefaciens]
MERRETRVERAWGTLRNPDGGDQSKGSALNILFNEQVSMRRDKINCTTTHSWDEAKKSCDRRSTIFNVDFRNALIKTDNSQSHGKPVANNMPQFSDVSIIGGNFSDTVFPLPIGAGIEIHSSDFRGSEIQAYMDPTAISGSDMTDAYITLPQAKLIFGNNVSNLQIVATSADSMTELDLSKVPENYLKNWAWADRPPRVVGVPNHWATSALYQFAHEPFLPKGIVLCDPVARRADPGFVGKLLSIGGRNRPPEFFPGLELEELPPGVLPLTDAKCQTVAAEDARKRWPSAYDHLKIQE